MEGERWAELWKERVVDLVVKKGGGKLVEEYREITLLPTLYKVYASALVKRLTKKLEEKCYTIQSNRF